MSKKPCPMGKLMITIVICTLATVTYAQLDRSKPPAPAPPKELKMSNYESFDLENGLRVFVVEDHRLSRVQFLIQLLHDPIQEGDKAGYTSIAASLMMSGTENRSKAQLDEEIDYVGAFLHTSSNSISASGLTKHKDRLLDLMTDVLYHPAFTKEELEKLKTQNLSKLAAEQEEPNSIAKNVHRVLFYGKNHPYSDVPKESTVKAITVEDCKTYYNTYFRPNNAYLVVVGDITLKEVQKIAEDRFSKWTPGQDIIAPHYPQPLAPEKTIVAFVDWPNAVQSIIYIGYPINLKIGNSDMIKVGVMRQILGGESGRLYKNLREKNAYTYGAYAAIKPDRLVGEFYAYTSARNEVTEEAVHEMLEELKRIVREPVTANELRVAKAAKAGSFVRALEESSTIASFAVATAKYNLPKDYYSTYLKKLEAVSVEDILAMAKKYIHPDHAYIQIVGKKTEIANQIQRFGVVKYYDRENYQKTFKAEKK